MLKLMEKEMLLGGGGIPTHGQRNAAGEGQHPDERYLSEKHLDRRRGGNWMEAVCLWTPERKSGVTTPGRRNSIEEHLKGRGHLEEGTLLGDLFSFFYCQQQVLLLLCFFFLFKEELKS